METFGISLLTLKDFLGLKVLNCEGSANPELLEKIRTESRMEGWLADSGLAVSDWVCSVDF